MQSEFDILRNAETLLHDGKAGAAAASLRGYLRSNSESGAARTALASLGDAARQDSSVSPADQPGLDHLRRAFAERRHQEVLNTASALGATYPDNAEIRNMMGVAHANLGRMEEAIAEFDRAVAADPAFAEPYIHLSKALRLIHQPKKALKAARAALDLVPGSADANTSAGLLSDDLDKTEAAESYFRAALKVEPAHVVAHDGLCRLLERSNQIEKLGDATETAVAACPNATPLKFRRGQYLFRIKDFTAARSMIEGVAPETLPDYYRPLWADILAKSLDQLGEFDAAFAAFRNMNEWSLPARPRAALDPNPYLKSVLDRQKTIAELNPAAWATNPAAATHRSPVFLIGYPRSGTTLVDTILRSHESIVVGEEFPIIDNFSREIRTRSEPDDLERLTAGQVDRMRCAYFAEFRRLTDTPVAGRLLVDKAPLNLSEAALIHRIFPNSRFILALRHPLDCALSCFMQNFHDTDSMNNFVTLEGTARLYDAVFSLWCGYTEKLGLKVDQIRYEDLIDDLPATITPVLENIGCRWSDKLLDYQAVARSRGKIKTASYGQVTEELYSTSRERWRHYEDHIAAVTPVLQPWIDHWGYQT